MTTITCPHCHIAGLVNFRRVTEWLEDGTTLDVVKCTVCGYWLKSRVVLTAPVAKHDRPRDADTTSKLAGRSMSDAAVSVRRQKLATAMIPCTKIGCHGIYLPTISKLGLCRDCAKPMQNYFGHKERCRTVSAPPLVRNGDGLWIDNPDYVRRNAASPPVAPAVPAVADPDTLTKAGKPRKARNSLDRPTKGHSPYSSHFQAALLVEIDRLAARGHVASRQLSELLHDERRSA